MLTVAVALLPAMATGQCNQVVTPIIQSTFLGQNRQIWVSLPEKYDSRKSYPVLYVLDAETHFKLIQGLENSLSNSKKIPEHIVVGIPHVNKEKERIKDLTFSLSKVNPYGDKILPPFFNRQNCGGGYRFLDFLNKELIPFVDSAYATTGFNILCGHSLSGYFASYMLSLPHSFQAVQLYDPSVWYAEGEATKQLQNGISKNKLSVFLAYQQNPDFHFQQVKSFGETLDKTPIDNYKREVFTDENHHSIFLIAFIHGMEWLYNDYKRKNFKLKKERPYSIPQ
ncbi:hypothetical protein SAMN05444274_102195 [Mariniphaga anaerophila]|uniref:Esterase n=1 Tax=Mariniphaga anaerophila TaxID=1484053 RepID=A0A1M4VSY2_9BACT|nr:alpha/beta hydrolase-fold protein [Mariniphaga anaerophila]SHE71922.1 hypothetical protein SAMN05444274_102195 [Mariniphaga anaerophila]